MAKARLLKTLLSVENAIDNGKISINTPVRKWGNSEVHTEKMVWGRNYIDGYKVDIYDKDKNNHLMSYCYDRDLKQINIESKGFFDEAIELGDLEGIKEIFSKFKIRINDSNILEDCILNNKFEIAEYLFKDQNMLFKNNINLSEVELDDFVGEYDVDIKKLFKTFDVKQTEFITFKLNDDKFIFSNKTPNINTENINKMKVIFIDILKQEIKDHFGINYNSSNVDAYAELLSSGIINNFLIDNNIKLSKDGLKILISSNSIVRENELKVFDNSEFSNGSSNLLCYKLLKKVNKKMNIIEYSESNKEKVRLSGDVGVIEAVDFENLAQKIQDDIKLDKFLDIYANNVFDIILKLKNYAKNEVVDPELNFKINQEKNKINIIEDKSNLILLVDKIVNKIIESGLNKKEVLDICLKKFELDLPLLSKKFRQYKQPETLKKEVLSSSISKNKNQLEIE